MLLFCTNIASGSSNEISYPLPSQVSGVAQAVQSLNGTWSFQYTPKGKWVSIQVPGEVVMQGYGIQHDKPFTYRKSFTLPADFANKRVILRFDGVYSHAKLTVNGSFIREHHGGFTRWESDITPFVKAGRKNELTLEVTDRLDDISYGSGYAHHPIGGILRGVTLFALPKEHLRNVVIETTLDTLYRHAELSFGCVVEGANGGKVELSLTDPTGQKVALAQNSFQLSAGKNSFVLPVQNPTKWDAEHPNLYTLSVAVTQNNQPTVRFSRSVGFRKVEVVKDQLLVNGYPVKLRGACRHDVHPTLGRTTTRELDSLDVVLFKRSNMNFVRTSHYPPSEAFLEFCDRYGVYVECETAVCFVDTYRQRNYADVARTENDSTFTDRYVGQCQEMVHSLRNHASIVMWSIGNESIYGSNFQRSWDWIKANDTTRPVIFSYPGTVKGAPVYDILSMHYQNVRGDVSQFGMSTRNYQGHGIPALFDEWAHPACYTYSTLQNDPNIREFWGKSIDMMWSGLFAARGGLGGAIWGYIDETFAVPALKEGDPFWKEFAHTAKPDGYRGNNVGYGQWGIVDIWRREKPEFWSTKKAHSPVRIEGENELAFKPGQRIFMTVYNRFDHTCLNEITAHYTYQGKKHPLPLPAIAPHSKGLIEIPAQQWSQGEELFIEFHTPQGELIDAYRPTLGAAKIDYPKPMGGTTLTVEQNDQQLVVVGQGFRVPFDKATGLITGATSGDRVVIEQGPFLHLDINLNHLSGAEVRSKAHNFATKISDWQMGSFGYKQLPRGVAVALKGRYNDVAVDFTIHVSPQGTIDIDYTTDGAPNGFLRETGLAFRLGSSFEELEWRRNGYWNYYPQGAFAGNEGSTKLTNSYTPAYGQEPRQAWKDDTHDYFYWADRGTDTEHPLRLAAKGMKEQIHYYTLKADARQLSVISRDASVACRLSKMPDQSLMLYTNNRWDYPEIAWGNYCKTLEALPCYGTIELQLR